MGAVLSQQNHPIAFFSKAFSPKLLQSSTYVRELAAITVAVKKWRQYLLGHSFVILTNHRSLKELMSQAIQTLEQQVYLACLLEFDYSIQYWSGKLNAAADALSRIPEYCSGQLWALTMPHLVFMEDLKAELHCHLAYLELRQSIIDNPTAYTDYNTTVDFILPKHRIWLPKGFSFIPLLLEEFHSTPTGGHMGIAKTLARVTQTFLWQGIKDDVCNFILQCLYFQQTKYDHRKSPGLLCPLPVPARPWEDLSLDLIGGLPSFRGYSVILVIVD